MNWIAAVVAPFNTAQRNFSIHAAISFAKKTNTAQHVYSVAFII